MRSSYLLVNQSQSDIQAEQGQSDIRINRSRFDIWVPRIQSNIRNATSIATPEYSGETTSPRAAKQLRSCVCKPSERLQRLLPGQSAQRQSSSLRQSGRRALPQRQMQPQR